MMMMKKLMKKLMTYMIDGSIFGAFDFMFHCPTPVSNVLLDGGGSLFQ